jgi:F420-dependent oxidoreductase-like protein
MLWIMSESSYTRVGYQIPNFTYPGVQPDGLFDAIAAQAVTAEQSGFDTVFVMDHFFQLPQIGPADHEMFDAYTLLGALAARTRTARLGTLVTGVTYRNPAQLAKAVTALDVISGGRALLGIGAAWFDVEHEALGFRFPPLPERHQMLREALEICTAMFRNKQASYTGTHFSIADAYNVPRPIQAGGPPIMVGGNGEKVTFRIAAQYADELNMISSPVELPRKLEALHGHLDAVGRPRDAVRTSWLGTLVIAPTQSEAEDVIVGMAAAQGLADPAQLLHDADLRAQLIPRVVYGDPDAVAARVKEIMAVGLDGIVFNMPAQAHDLDAVKLAGTTLRAVVG